MENIYLVGSEEVQQAATVMMSAANRMVAAVNTHDSSLTAFMQFMDGWITRLEAVMEKFNCPAMIQDDKPSGNVV